jgi:hypothetical protein
VTSYYARHLETAIKAHFKKYKEVLVLLGARQVGKTTLLKKCLKDAYFLSVDNEPVRQNLERYDIAVYKQLLPVGIKEVVIDEIHLLSNPGRAAKIIHDQMPEVKLIITGSSSLQIKSRASESLAGRKIDYFLYPLTFSEILYQKGVEKELNFQIWKNFEGEDQQERFHPFDVRGILESILVFGQYPAMMDRPSDEKYLLNLVDSVIFKDLLELKTIANRPAALSLLRLLAYQIGSLANKAELANRLRVDIATVSRYLSLFEQSLIIFPLRPFTGRARDEIGKMSKFYFYDVGLRNALIENFQPLNSRTDYGILFENFIVSEILKINAYLDLGLKMHFWRTKQGSKIDLVLINREGKICAVEIKTGKERLNHAFLNRYPRAKIKTVTPNNFY